MKQTPMPKVKAEMNVTPLVDIALVLLIVFMVLTPLLTNHGMPVQLPESRKPGQKADKPEQLDISLTQERQIYVGTEKSPLSKKEFARRLGDLHQAKPETPVYLSADTRLPYREVKEVMGLLTDSGFANISLMVRKEREE